MPKSTFQLSSHQDAAAPVLDSAPVTVSFRFTNHQDRTCERPTGKEPAEQETAETER